MFGSITDGLDLAEIHMKSAMQHMGVAWEIVEPFVGLDADALERESAHTLAGQTTQAVPIYRQGIFAATVLFQAGMEASIYWFSNLDQAVASARPARTNISGWWRDAFTAKGSTHDFAPYADFYGQCRNALVHPDRQVRIDKANEMTFVEVYEGLRAGWGAYGALASACGLPHTPNSWAILCGQHGVPAPLPAGVPHLPALPWQLLQQTIAGR